MKTVEMVLGTRTPLTVEGAGSLVVVGRGALALVRHAAWQVRGADVVALAGDDGWPGEVYSFYSAEGVDAVYDLAVLAEQRRYGRQAGKPVLLVLAGLELAGLWDAEGREALLWLVRNGVQGGVHVLAAYDAQRRVRRQSGWERLFGWRQVGPTAQVIAGACAMHARADWFGRWSLCAGQKRLAGFA